MTLIEEDIKTIINFTDPGEGYYEYGIMQSFKGWKKAQKVNGELKWWKV